MPPMIQAREEEDEEEKDIGVCWVDGMVGSYGERMTLWNPGKRYI